MFDIVLTTTPKQRCVRGMMYSGHLIYPRRLARFRVIQTKLSQPDCTLTDLSSLKASFYGVEGVIKNKLPQMHQRFRRFAASVFVVDVDVSADFTFGIHKSFVDSIFFILEGLQRVQHLDNFAVVVHWEELDAFYVTTFEWVGEKERKKERTKERKKERKKERTKERAKERKRE